MASTAPDNHRTPAQHAAAARAGNPDLWTFCTELDLRTSLALARAVTRALSGLSPAAEHALFKALTQEIHALENQREDPMALPIAMALKQYLPGY